MKFTGKTSDQRKCSRSALAEAYVDKRVAGKIPLQARNQMLREMDWWTLGGVDVSIASTCLACVMQDLKFLSFNLQWFRELGALFSSFGCFVFESWVLRLRVLGASFSRFGRFVLRSSFSKLTIRYIRKDVPR